MSKEYVLAIMEEKTGMLVCDIEVEEHLKLMYKLATPWSARNLSRLEIITRTFSKNL